MGRETQNKLDKTKKGAGLRRSGRWKEKGARKRERAQGRGKTSSFSLPSLTTQLDLNKFLATPAKSFPSDVSSAPWLFLVALLSPMYCKIMVSLLTHLALRRHLTYHIQWTQLLFSHNFHIIKVLLPFLFPPKRDFLKNFVNEKFACRVIVFFEKLLLLLLSTLGLSNRVLFKTPFRKSKGY